ncbi:hypothetical protein ECZU08_18600 [Escherichia coli]|nr:hypothetical protein ECZU08_18600 [Escherichia coli]
MIAGALLMTLGHVVLGIDTNSTFSLYLALAIIICGYGLFKSNISCLLGELYDENDHRRDGGFSLLYAAGNIGSIAAPIACGGCSVVWMACWLCPCGRRHVYRFVDFLKWSSSFPVHA